MSVGCNNSGFSLSQEDFTSDTNIRITPKILIPSVTESSDWSVDTRSTRSGSLWKNTLINGTGVVIGTSILDPACSASVLLVALSVKLSSSGTKSEWALDFLVRTTDSISFNQASVQSTGVLVITSVLDNFAFSVLVTLVLGTWGLLVTILVADTLRLELALKVFAESNLAFRISVALLAVNIMGTFSASRIFLSGFTDQPSWVLLASSGSSLVVHLTFIDVALVVKVFSTASLDVNTLRSSFLWVLNTNILGAWILIITHGVINTLVTAADIGMSASLGGWITLVNGTWIIVVTLGIYAFTWSADVDALASVGNRITLANNTFIIGGAISMSCANWGCSCGGGDTSLNRSDNTGSSLGVTRGDNTWIIRLASLITRLDAS